MLLLLIDGHAILHRAYHALPPMNNKDGVATNAVYGFTTMLLRLLDGFKPEYLAVAFDRPEATFRMQMYTPYQGKRPEMEGNLKDQIPLVHELLDALKIQYFEAAGFEADDVIGTIANQVIQRPKAEESHKNDLYEIPLRQSADRDDNLEVIIVTGDRDMLQLINSHVKVMVPIRGLSESKMYDPELVEKEFGVTPSQWVDVKALKGDASDNYLGVRGIGPKTAEKMIQKYGTLENLYGKLGELGKSDPKTAKKLAEGVEMAGMSQKLATIKTDVPGVHLDLEKCKAERIGWEAGMIYMRNELGFRSIVEKIEKNRINKTNKAVKTNKHDDPGEQLGLI